MANRGNANRGHAAGVADPPDPLAVLPAVSGPTDPYARTEQTFPRLTDDQVGRVAAFGVVEDLPAGTVLFEIGDHRVDFFLVLESSRPGVFAVGDVRADSVKRVASGVGEGSVVVSSVHHHLARNR